MRVRGSALPDRMQDLPLTGHSAQMAPITCLRNSAEELGPRTPFRALSGVMLGSLALRRGCRSDEQRASPEVDLHRMGRQQSLIPSRSSSSTVVYAPEKRKTKKKKKKKKKKKNQKKKKKKKKKKQKKKKAMRPPIWNPFLRYLGKDGARPGGGSGRCSAKASASMAARSR